MAATDDLARLVDLAPAQLAARRRRRPRPAPLRRPRRRVRPLVRHPPPPRARHPPPVRPTLGSRRQPRPARRRPRRRRRLRRARPTPHHPPALIATRSPDSTNATSTPAAPSPSPPPPPTPPGTSTEPSNAHQHPPSSPAFSSPTAPPPASATRSPPAATTRLSAPTEASRSATATPGPSPTSTPTEPHRQPSRAGTRRPPRRLRRRATSSSAGPSPATATKATPSTSAIAVLEPGTSRNHAYVAITRGRRRQPRLPPRPHRHPDPARPRRHDHPHPRPRIRPRHPSPPPPTAGPSRRRPGSTRIGRRLPGSLNDRHPVEATWRDPTLEDRAIDSASTAPQHQPVAPRPRGLPRPVVEGYRHRLLARPHNDGPLHRQRVAAASRYRSRPCRASDAPAVDSIVSPQASTGFGLSPSTADASALARSRPSAPPRRRTPAPSPISPTASRAQRRRPPPLAEYALDWVDTRLTSRGDPLRPRARDLYALSSGSTSARRSVRSHRQADDQPRSVTGTLRCAGPPDPARARPQSVTGSFAPSSGPQSKTDSFPANPCTIKGAGVEPSRERADPHSRAGIPARRRRSPSLPLPRPRRRVHRAPQK